MYTYDSMDNDIKAEYLYYSFVSYFQEIRNRVLRFLIFSSLYTNVLA